MQWSERTWCELPTDLLAASSTALLPLGAVEQHGPHLGCGTDAVIAHRLATEVARRLSVPMLPTLPYGSSAAHSRRWPGTISLPPVLLTQVVVEIGRWAFASGVRRLFLVNAHVGNAAPLRCALDMLRCELGLMVALVNTGELSERVRETFRADGNDWHANDAETSLIMALSPELLRDEALASADDPDRTGGLVFAHPVNCTSLNGVTGMPSRATIAKGRQLFAWMVDDLAQLVTRGMCEHPPLNQPNLAHAPQHWTITDVD